MEEGERARESRGRVCEGQGEQQTKVPSAVFHREIRLREGGRETGRMAGEEVKIGRGEREVKEQGKLQRQIERENENGGRKVQ